MSITPVLYIILGLSVGVGITLIYLQEKFVGERRNLVALRAAEKAKTQELLKELDAKWEQEAAERLKEIEDARRQITNLEEVAKISDKKIAELEERVRSQDEGDGIENNDNTDEFNRSLQEKEDELAGLLKEKNDLLDNIAETRQEISDLHGEIEFLKGNITRLEEERKAREQNEDYLVMTPGNHVIPGPVARALMGKKE